MEQPSDTDAGRRGAVAALAEHGQEAITLAFSPSGGLVPWPATLPGRSPDLRGVRILLDLVRRDDYAAVVRAWQEATHTGTASTTIRLLSQPDRPVRLQFTDLRDSDGVVVGAITADAEAGGDERAEPLPPIVVARPRAITVRLGRRGELREWNETIGRFNGWTRHELVARPGLDLVHPDDRETARTAWREMLDRGRSRPRRWQSLLPDGSYAWIEVAFTNRLDDPRHRDVLATATDVTEEVKAGEALRAQERLLNRLAQVVPVGLAEVRPDGWIAYANDQLGALFGTGPATTFAELITTVVVADRDRATAALGDALAGRDRTVDVDVRSIGPGGPWAGGQPRRCRIDLRPLVDRVGNVTSAIVCVSDITDATRQLADLELDLVQHATRDQLTGLANRATLLDRIEDAAARSRESGDPAALMVVDVDDFKAVNDTFGQSAGDHLLVAMSDRLRALARPTDVVARVGGDEFALLMAGFLDPDHPRRTARLILAACAQPVEIDGRPLSLGASIGIATTAHAADGRELLRDADLALRRAKARGRGGCEIFDPQVHAAAVNRAELEASLRRALDDDQLLVAYQPIHDVATGDVTSVEALVRWRHPIRGMVPPGDFIPLAEATGLIVPLGRQVLVRACAEATRWPAPAPAVSVNISARQLGHSDLVADVAAALDGAGLPADRLILEITESVLMERTDANLRRLDELKALGVKLAIDDFGTGYSSLAYLERLPVDVLKIDKAFVDEVATSRRHTRLVEGILTLSRDLGLTAVAEGVETADQLDALRALRCPHAQGYLFARPLDADDLRPYLAAPGR